jgi:hypothetical protein
MAILSSFHTQITPLAKNGDAESDLRYSPVMQRRQTRLIMLALEVITRTTGCIYANTNGVRCGVERYKTLASTACDLAAACAANDYFVFIKFCRCCHGRFIHHRIHHPEFCSCVACQSGWHCLPQVLPSGRFAGAVVVSGDSVYIEMRDCRDTTHMHRHCLPHG